MPLKTKPFDILEHIQTPETQAGYLLAALEDGDHGTIALVLGDIVRAVGIAKIVKETGISRETIYKSFVDGGNPTIKSVLKIAKAVGLKLTLQPTKTKVTKRTIKTKVTRRKARTLKAA